MSELPRLLTRAEVARALGVDVSSLSRWEKRGAGPRNIRLGDQIVRYDAADVAAFIESRKSA